MIVAALLLGFYFGGVVMLVMCEAVGRAMQGMPPRSPEENRDYWKCVALWPVLMPLRFLELLG